MLLKSCLIICSLLVCLGQIDSVLNPRVVCYYESWWVWRNGDGKMTVDNVDASLCTHIVYAYQGISATFDVAIQDDWLMVQQHDLDKFSANKGKAQALVAIGGYSLSNNFGAVIASSGARSTFIQNLISFFRKFNFDGVSLDWTHPQFTEYEFNDFAQLLQDMHTQFAGKYTIALTVAAQPLGTAFKASKIDSYVDFFMPMTYDFHGNWEMTVNYGAPFDWQLSVLKDWFRNGATMSKIVMTIPLFGHTWILQDTSKTQPGANAIGAGRQGPWSQSDGKLSYNEICTQIKTDPNAWDIHKTGDDVYAVHGNTWVTFENVVTVEDKTKNITTQGYGGVVVQALANEDFKGLCGEKYPLLHAINKGLNKDPVSIITLPPTVAPPTTTPTPAPTADPHKLCHKEGLVRDPQNCNTYHKCTEFMPGVFTDEQLICASGLAFDESDGKCKDKALVSGCH